MRFAIRKETVFDEVTPLMEFWEQQATLGTKILIGDWNLVRKNL